MLLGGTPSDEVGEILDAGRGDISILFVSMATRHPDGLDTEYLRWHTSTIARNSTASVRCAHPCAWYLRRRAGLPGR